MVEISSREQLRQWLHDKPTDWAQFIASRAGQRALPYSFVQGTPDKWVSTYSLVPFRSTMMSWGACNDADYPLNQAVAIFGDLSNMVAQAGINFDDSRAYSAIYASGHAVSAMIPESEFGDDLTSDDASAILIPQFDNHLMYCLSNAVAYAEMAVGSHVMRSIHHDCNWLEIANGSNGLSRVALWKVSPPYGWPEAWAAASSRLLALDPTYQVWIDWYNRRIEGHDAAFDIPGDTNRIHDKAILARLADATDEDFWGKGATYVNTTLQRWIDEARIEARIDAATAKLQGGAIPDYNIPEASTARADALREIDRLLVEPSDPRLKIGGNQPPEDIDPEEKPVVLPPAIRESIIDIKEELQADQPDALKIAEKSKLLLRLIKWRADIADATGDHFAKGFGEEFGKLVAGDVHKLLRAAVMGLLALVVALLGLAIGLIF
jgi:hypothetical protein